ncbi:MAG: hypothetical protein JNL21_27610 [Myxococcales bacterium]|nr:hypothetical protein [Myxococcales bacterium]
MSTTTTTPETGALELRTALQAIDTAHPRSYREREELASRRRVVAWALAEGDALSAEARAEIARSVWAYLGELSRGSA